LGLCCLLSDSEAVELVKYQKATYFSSTGGRQNKQVENFAVCVPRPVHINHEDLGRWEMKRSRNGKLAPIRTDETTVHSCTSIMSIHAFLHRHEFPALARGFLVC
jgi:hypothetical protein